MARIRRDQARLTFAAGLAFVLLAGTSAARGEGAADFVRREGAAFTCGGALPPPPFPDCGPAPGCDVAPETCE